MALLLVGAFSGLAWGESPDSNLRMTPIVKAVREARPSVVNIHGHKTVVAEDSNPAHETMRRVNGMGTGVIIDDRGYILTNYHVVDGVRQILVTFHDKRTLVARLVAHDPQTDLAVIKVAAEQPWSVIKVGTSSDLMQGEPVIAIGNAFGYDHTVTRGIVSALHRPVQVSEQQKYTDLIQTDACINPGNSGGPLLNIYGEMIGINVAVRVGANGIGFAIPVDEALQVVGRLISSERLSSLWHGVNGDTIRNDSGLQFVVRSVDRDSPAEKIGLRPGDVIAAANAQSVARAVDLERAFLERKAGEEVELQVVRSGQSLSLQLATQAMNGAKPSDADLAWEILGLRLNSIPAGEFKEMTSRYRGGLRVAAVRADSPAARQGIRAGDVLVGMHKWETISQENVNYVLKHPDIRRSDDPVLFYILRGEETLFGHLTLQPRDTRR